MDPEKLIRWETVLQSQFAVSLILLAVVLALIPVCLMLWKENRHLNRIFREHLQAQGDFRVVIENVREAIDLVRGDESETHRAGV